MTSRTRAFSLAFSFLGLVCASWSFTAQAKKTLPLKSLPRHEVSVSTLLPDHKRRALELLPVLTEQIDALESVVWKVRLKGFLAELVGKQDPAAARRLFEQGLRNLDSVPVLARLEEWGFKEGLPAIELKRLESELLARAATVDAQSAEALAEKITGAAQAGPAETERLVKKKAFLFGQVAQSLATEQPEVAARWVEKSFETGVTGWAARALDIIRQQNPQLADATLGKALSQLELDSGSSTQSVMALASYLFPGTVRGTLTFNDGDDDVAFNMNPVQSVSAADARPEVASRFLSLAYDSCIANLSAIKPSQINAGTGELDGLGKAVVMLRRLLEERSPEKALSLQARLDELGKQLPLWNGMPLGSMMDFLGGLGDPRRTSEQTQALALMNVAMRDTHYQVQAIRAIRKGRVEEAMSLMEKVKSDEAKAEIQSELAARRITNAIEQGQLDSALAQTRAHSDISQQIRFLTQIAQKQIDQKKTEEALLCLVEAEQLLNRLPEAFSRPYFATEIVEKMAILNPERAFSSVARLVEEINKASGISEEPKPVLPPPNREQLDPTTYNLLNGKSFSLLAEADFDAALAVAQSIIQPETSIAAQLAVCRAALSDTGKGQRAIARSSP